MFLKIILPKEPANWSNSGRTAITSSLLVYLAVFNSLLFRVRPLFFSFYIPNSFIFLC